MAKKKFKSEVLLIAFNREKILSLREMKRILGTSSRMTIYRNVKELSYYSSYSDKGQYYTVEEIPNFDENGLWSCKSVHFSKLIPGTPHLIFFFGRPIFCGLSLRSNRTSIFQ